MPSTHSSLHGHVIFSTKNRFPFISEDWRKELHAYIGGCAKRLDVVPVEIGGIADHVHLLVGVKTSHAIADIVR